MRLSNALSHGAAAQIASRVTPSVAQSYAQLTVCKALAWLSISMMNSLNSSSRRRRQKASASVYPNDLQTAVCVASEWVAARICVARTLLLRADGCDEPRCPKGSHDQYCKPVSEGGAEQLACKSKYAEAVSCSAPQLGLRRVKPTRRRRATSARRPSKQSKNDRVRGCRAVERRNASTRCGSRRR